MLLLTRFLAPIGVNYFYGRGKNPGFPEENYSLSITILAPIGACFLARRSKVQNKRLQGDFCVMINSFIEAIKIEQRRIQRLIDLSTPLETNGRGHLRLLHRGSGVYAYERWQQKGAREHSKYLGRLESQAVRELFSLRFKAQRLVRLRRDQKLLDQLMRQYRRYDFESVLNDMPTAYRAAAHGNSFNQRYEELRDWANEDYPKNAYPFPRQEIYAADGTRLRSKGECIFYNLLQGRGILFRYECEIEITECATELQRGRGAMLFLRSCGICCSANTLFSSRHDCRKIPAN